MQGGENRKIRRWGSLVNSATFKMFANFRVGAREHRMYIFLGKTYVCSQSRYIIWLTIVVKESIKEAIAANRASLVVLYYKPESGKKWKDMNYGSGQQGRSLYSSFIYRLKNGFGKFFKGFVTSLGMFCFGKALKFGRTVFS